MMCSVMFENHPMPSPQSDDQMRFNWLYRGIQYLRRTDLGISFLLAVPTWFVLVFLWTQSTPDQISYKIIARLFVPAANAGEALARLFLSDRVLIIWTGAAAELLVLIFIWYMAIRTAKLMGYFETERQKPNQS
jgi:hypothetical protein